MPKFHSREDLLRYARMATEQNYADGIITDIPRERRRKEKQGKKTCRITIPCDCERGQDHGEDCLSRQFAEQWDRIVEESGDKVIVVGLLVDVMKSFKTEVLRGVRYGSGDEGV